MQAVPRSGTGQTRNLLKDQLHVGVDQRVLLVEGHALAQQPSRLVEMVGGQMGEPLGQHAERRVLGQRHQRRPHRHRIERPAGCEVKKAELEASEREFRRNLHRPRHRSPPLIVPLHAREHRTLEKMQPRIERPGAKQFFQPRQPARIIAIKLRDHRVEPVLGTEPVNCLVHAFLPFQPKLAHSGQPLAQ